MCERCKLNIICLFAKHLIQYWESSSWQSDSPLPDDDYIPQIKIKLSVLQTLLTADCVNKRTLKKCWE